MTNTARRILKVAAICGFGAIAAPAMATNGYFVNGYGAPSKSMAGAGVAVPTGVLGLAQNPAMGVKVRNSS
jgi:long-chain fatty acid transport protein